MKNILVSINCITYNHERYIRDAIDSFLMQKTDFDFEILIGEDCSTDGTRKIVQEYVDKYPKKVRLITSDKNVGARKNLLRLHENSRGKYIALCEGDDYWTNPHKLQNQVDYLENHPKCSMSFHAAEVVRADKTSVNRLVKPYDKNKIVHVNEFILGGGGFFPTASLVFRKHIMDIPPKFYLKASVGDYPLVMILSSHGYAYYINKIMSSYRTGTSVSWTNRNLKGKNIRQKKIKNYESDISILKGFNKYSNFKYNDIVEKAILERKCYIYIFRKDIKAFRKSNNYNFFKNLSLKKKIKMISLGCFPKLYIKLAEVKNKLKTFI